MRLRCFAEMSSLSIIHTPSLLQSRRRVHETATEISLFFPSFSRLPMPGLHIPYRFPYATIAASSAPSLGSRFTTAASGGALLQDVGATAAVLGGAYGLILTFDVLTQRNIIQQKLSRKLVHILSGLLFAISWPIFSTSVKARYFASLVPLLNCLKLLVYGLSLDSDKALTNSLTREGNPKELLRGPLYYVLILILCALVFWRESPVGVISLSMMCGGDGVADILGRRFGSLKLPYNQQKSWVGSMSMFTAGFLMSIGMLYYYSALGYFRLEWISATQKVALVALVATLVESLPTTEIVDDNISVPLSSMVVAYLSFGF